MTRNIFRSIFTWALMCSLVTPFAFGAERGRGGGQGQPGGRQSPGGAWSERTHQGGDSGGRHESSRSTQSPTGDARGAGTSTGRPSQTSGNADPAGGAAAFNQRNSPTTSGTQDAAAGAAAANRQPTQASGEQAAAAGAAAANRRAPQYSGAQGAAAGAAAANRNSPQYSGAQGAAAGAAAANRNSPQYSGAQGAAVGAAVANSSAPTYSGAEGAVAGAAAAGQYNPPASDATGAAVGSAAVKNSFNNYGMYSPQWSAAHPEAWTPAQSTAGTVWTPTSWQAVSAYLGANTPPTWYDYGSNVTYQDGNIMMAGQNLGTAEEYSQQAADLAESGAAAEPPADSDWLPLGVFAMVRNEHQHPQLIMQLAINKRGALRGNFTDELTEHTQPVRGAYNATTQRAAWIVGDHKTAIMEAGLANLSEGDAPALIHKNGKTDHWLLVRLKQPVATENAAATPNVPQ